jgi:hypothetical protein
MSMSASDRARLALAGIRTVNGVLALFAPAVLARRMGANPPGRGPTLYPLRLFGIRTVLLGIELAVVTGDPRRRALQAGLLIHASDTLSAGIAGLRREVPPRFALTATAISAVNTGLAAVALAGEEQGRAT